MSFITPLFTLSFCYPQAFVVGLACFFFAITRRVQSGAVLVPSVDVFAGTAPSWRLRLRRPVLSFLATGFLAAITVAAARPQHVTISTSPYAARNIVLALDISRSMSTDDFQSRSGNISRLEGVKQVVDQFIEARAQDRLGLVVFGSNAYLQSPLTLDHNVLQDLVSRLDVGIAGDGTAMGDGLGLSLKRIQEIEGSSKAVILLTDGVSNAGHVNPLKAAKVAKDLGVKVHTIGIGSSSTISTVQRGFFTQQLMAQAEFDEATLQQIADITGGVYFNANSIEGLEKVYAQIDKLERSENTEPERRVVEELFMPYASAALLLYLLYVAFARTVFLKVP